MGVLKWLYLEQADKYFTASKVADAYARLESDLVFIAFVRLLLKVRAIAWRAKPSTNNRRFCDKKNPLLLSISFNLGDKGQTLSTKFPRDMLPGAVLS